MDSLEKFYGDYLSLSVILTIIILIIIIFIIKAHYDMSPGDPARKNFYALMLGTGVYIFVPIISLLYLNNTIITERINKQYENPVAKDLSNYEITPVVAPKTGAGDDTGMQKINRLLNGLGPGTINVAPVVSEPQQTMMHPVPPNMDEDFIVSV